MRLIAGQRIVPRTVLALLAWAVVAAPGGAVTPIEPGQPATLVLPAPACAGSGLERCEVDVTFDATGGLVVAGDPGWRGAGLPLVIAGQLTSVKPAKKSKPAIVTFEGDGAKVELRVQPADGWQDRLGEILVPGHSTITEPSPELTSSLDRLLEAYSASRFSPPLDVLEPRIRRRVAELQLAVGDLEAPSTSSRGGVTYFDARLGEGAVIYNRASGSEGQWVANSLAYRVLPAVEAWARVFFGELPFEGFAFTATVTAKDYTKYPPEPESDQLELLVSLADAEAFAAEDLTAQALVDAAAVSLNGRPVRIDLASATISPR
ncbi:MAG: hypothetical protein MUC56_09320 [Thermoanaerobaculales bacterium]|jgi:hypothetical protein|nr:hypothetical protein [Thermoanaerobaculales bacterium]